MAKATVAIRVESSLYDELVKIAEKRDVTITEALGFYIARRSGQAAQPALMQTPAACPDCGQPFENHEFFLTQLIDHHGAHVKGIRCPG
jgi:hypothetical protein